MVPPDIRLAQASPSETRVAEKRAETSTPHLQVAPNVLLPLNVTLLQPQCSERKFTMSLKMEPVSRSFRRRRSCRLTEVARLAPSGTQRPCALVRVRLWGLADTSRNISPDCEEDESFCGTVHHPETRRPQRGRRPQKGGVPKNNGPQHLPSRTFGRLQTTLEVSTST